MRLEEKIDDLSGYNMGKVEVFLIKGTKVEMHGTKPIAP